MESPFPGSEARLYVKKNASRSRDHQQRTKGERNTKESDGGVAKKLE
jgi:hypothetical protein